MAGITSNGARKNRDLAREKKKDETPPGYNERSCSHAGIRPTKTQQMLTQQKKKILLGGLEHRELEARCSDILGHSAVYCVGIIIYYSE